MKVCPRPGASEGTAVEKGLLEIQLKLHLSRTPDSETSLTFRRCQNHVVRPHGLHDNSRCPSWNGQMTEQPEGSRMMEQGKVGDAFGLIVFNLPSH